MCGIAGLAGKFEKSVSENLLETMMEKIAHRGPDAKGTLVENGVALGHQRLAIVDLSEAGNQPMASQCGNFVLIFNGEVYNFETFKNQIPNISFHSQTDTEAVLEAFAKWDMQAFQKMNGMFALAIWNRKTQELVLVRDRLGIKPLYYHIGKEGLAFASEIRALVATKLFKPSLNPEALTDFLTYQTVHAPNTMLEQVMMLPAGSYLRFKDGKTEIGTYWDLADQGQNPFSGSYDEALSEIKNLLGQAVEKRLMSDVPLGAFLSGGIDSSAIVALMAQATEKPVETFSVIFNEKEFDESPWSEMIAKKYNTRHHPILLKPESFLEELPAAMAAMDHPSGDGINSYVVSKVTRNAGITVALSGLGGDELFAGYPVFKQLPGIAHHSLWKLPKWLRRALLPTVGIFPGGRKGEKLAGLLRLSGNQIQDIYPVFRTVFDPKEIAKLAPGAKQDYNYVQAFTQKNASKMQQMPSLSRISLGEISTYTQNVLLRDTDQMSMAHALEVRVPFFDHELVEFVMGVHDQYKKPTYPKKLLVESLGDLLPDEVVHRKKMGFVLPWESWIRNELNDYCTQKLNYLAKSSWFDGNEILKTHTQFKAGKGSALWLHIWLLVVLADWMEKIGIEP